MALYNGQVGGNAAAGQETTKRNGRKHLLNERLYIDDLHSLGAMGQVVQLICSGTGYLLYATLYAAIGETIDFVYSFTPSAMVVAHLLCLKVLSG